MYVINISFLILITYRLYVIINIKTNFLNLYLVNVSLMSEMNNDFLWLDTRVDAPERRMK